ADLLHCRFFPFFSHMLKYIYYLPTVNRVATRNIANTKGFIFWLTSRLSGRLIRGASPAGHSQDLSSLRIVFQFRTMGTFLNSRPCLSQQTNCECPRHLYLGPQES